MLKTNENASLSKMNNLIITKIINILIILLYLKYYKLYLLIDKYLKILKNYKNKMENDFTNKDLV